MDEKLKRIFLTMFHVGEEDFPTASMRSVRSWDSLKHIELMMSLEEEFQLPPMTSDEIVRMTSVEQIRVVLSSKGARP